MLQIDDSWGIIYYFYIFIIQVTSPWESYPGEPWVEPLCFESRIRPWVLSAEKDFNFFIIF